MTDRETLTSATGELAMLMVLTFYIRSVMNVTLIASASGKTNRTLIRSLPPSTLNNPGEDSRKAPLVPGVPLNGAIVYF